ncbi:unnamed protein product, partial [Chrysoparadoxa australica]
HGSFLGPFPVSPLSRSPSFSSPSFFSLPLSLVCPSLHSLIPRSMDRASLALAALLAVLCLCEGFHITAPYQRCFTRVSSTAEKEAGVGSGDGELSQYAASQHEIERRRNFAIVSHPDAGKTTLTEKLLLYGGAIQEAGAVRSRADQRKATSDYMELEKQRGISITSTVMSFEYMDNQINLLDTPGHQDFSEDTFRTLAAADNAVMLIDAAKGLETQTRKLMEVCRLRGLPIFTFCNKMDRPSLSPFELLDQVEGEFGLELVPILWPIGDGERFQGVLDRQTKKVHLFERGDRTGKAKALSVIELDSPDLEEAIGSDLHDQLLEDVEMLDGLIEPLDINKIHEGSQSPMFFGSAMVNFGVELFLERFLSLGVAPAPRTLAGAGANSDDDAGEDAPEVHPEYPQFTGFVFKLQANLDPRHRDRLAYVRVVSGKYEKGMKVHHSRMKNRQITLAQATQLFAQDRETVQVAYPGDIIGINNPGHFAIGDTIYTGNQRISYPGIPSFSPECFSYMRNPNPSTYKNYRKGIDQLLAEGAVQLLRERSDDGNGNPLLAAVGSLQFDVVQYRMKDEYGVDAILEPLLGFDTARWSEAGWDAVDKAEQDGKLFGVFQAKDQFGRPVLLFRNSWKLQSVQDEMPELQLVPWATPPSEE